MYIVTKPDVQLLAATHTEVDFGRYLTNPDSAEDGSWLIEYAGRNCYQSFHRPNPATANTHDYIANIVKQGHHSVLEHVQATFLLRYVSRSFTHELVRHRHLSFSELSQRFVDMTEPTFVIPPALADNPDSREELCAAAQQSVETYQRIVASLADQGLPRKQAREAARAVLPNCVATQIVVSGNLRAWRDMLQKRCSPHADAEFAQVAQMIRQILQDRWPTVFDGVGTLP